MCFAFKYIHIELLLLQSRFDGRHLVLRASTAQNLIFSFETDQLSNHRYLTFQLSGSHRTERQVNIKMFQVSRILFLRTAFQVKKMVCKVHHD